MALVAGDGSLTDTVNVVGPPLGVRGVATYRVGNASPYLSVSINDNAAATDTTRTTTVSTATGGVGRIGAYTGGTGVIDMEFEGLITLDDAVSAIEHSRVVEYYNGGL